MFTIAHMSDLHLGYLAGRKRIDENGFNVRENDGYLAYSRAIDQIIEEGVDMVLVAGDMFHSPRPKNHTILIAQEGLRRLSEAGIKTYIIAGNHDATDIRAEVPSSKLLHEPNGQIYSYSEPYVVKEVHDGIYMHFLSHHAYVDQKGTMEGIKLIPDAINILASHGSCYDTNMGVILKTPNEPREVIIPQEIMDLPWDYTFLGHIHERGWISSSNGGRTDTAGRKQFYNGSILRRGFADKESVHGRGWTKWTVKDNGEITPKFFVVPEREQLDMEPIQVEGKTPQQIERAIVDQLKAIDNYMEEKYGAINIENTPIVRQTIVGVNAITRLSLNLQRFNQYTEKYLTHSFKIVPNMEYVEVKETVSIDELNNSDIVVVFDEWKRAQVDQFGFDSSIKDDITETAKEILTVSRDEMLTQD